MNTSHHFACGLAVALVCGANISPAAAQSFREIPPDILAVQLRSQGFACERPVSAVRDKKLSKPDEAVWILNCQNGSYQMRLTAGMAAKVKRLP